MESVDNYDGVFEELFGSPRVDKFLERRGLERRPWTWGWCGSPAAVDVEQ